MISANLSVTKLNLFGVDRLARFLRSSSNEEDFRAVSEVYETRLTATSPKRLVPTVEVILLCHYSPNRAIPDRIF
ncbi:hypothetical protein QUA82_10520 [Microcoleus sp. F8-D3]